MADFFSTQMDFIFFFYGLAFILLGATCFAIAKGDRKQPWTVLGLFGVVHGASEWLDLTALIVGDAFPFALARTVLMTVSFLLLMEFARLEAIHFGLRPPGRWLYVVLVLLAAYGGFAGGLNVAGVTARYAIGLVGSLAASVLFALHARGFSGAARRFSILAAVGFALYGVAAGAIVPAVPFWPASVFNYEWFIHNTGVPIQLVRGVLACWIALSIWAIWGQKLILKVSSERFTRFLRKQFVLTAGAMATILVLGWLLTEFLGGIYQRNVQDEARGDINLLASRFSGETGVVEAVGRTLAGSPSVLPLLVGGSRHDREVAQAVLEVGVKASGAKLGYILDLTGAIVAAFDPRDDSALQAPGDASTSHFSKANAGEPISHFALDPVERRPYFYAIYPIRLANSEVVGHAVLKKSLNVLEADLRAFDQPYFFVDPDGLIVLTNQPALLLRQLWPPSSDRKSIPARQSPTVNIAPPSKREIVDATWINLGGERVFVRRRFANDSEWSLVLTIPMAELFANRVLGIVITLLATLMALIYLFGKERSVYDSVQMDKRLKLQELARSLEFQASTDPLTGLFNRMKFDQALAAEILRANRYNRPLSLVLFDIDHFKNINDLHGHQVGDNVLVQLSRIAAAHIRGTDVLARWGGEEFVILVPESNGQMAYQTAENLRNAIGQAVFEKAGAVTCSFGVAEYVDGDAAESLISRADAAMYRAKIKGRNQAELSSVTAPSSVETSFPSPA
ncbi:diguanylate cyclase [Methylocella silvestris BL2]|uniref:diguanylate cyclase n=1 Tax=Methylocella silvestris (strain DSM 15510 / CIP 108128 / LMG 27833 / NCIMB 13906 / BL2) TaxID=395965 RepID=B8EJQ5_METSB|nr:sensor domain-containing diguanylate cyclase [Methylocella silvestris]ACK49459.1 diguanylate cyclase [Methylocella silvestris BL2]